MISLLESYAFLAGKLRFPCNVGLVSSLLGKLRLPGLVLYLLSLELCFARLPVSGDCVVVRKVSPDL